MPQATPRDRLVEAHYEEVKGQWEERFEARRGHWRGFVDEVVARHLDCGVVEPGLARVRCRDCHAEHLAACSRKGRGLCPSCGANRAAGSAAFLRDEVLEPVGHCLRTFSLPETTRPYFLHHRDLLGKLCHAAWETVQELVTAAAGEVDGFRFGMVVAVQTAGDSLGLNPHAHAIAPRGGWDRDERWVPVPFVDPDAAEKLLRHKVLSFLKGSDGAGADAMCRWVAWYPRREGRHDSRDSEECDEGSTPLRAGSCGRRGRADG